MISARPLRALGVSLLVAPLFVACDGAAGSGGSLGPSGAAAAEDAVTYGEIADFGLVRQDGETVTLADLRGKPWVLGCFFTSCRGPCPDMTRSMLEVQSELADTETVLVSLSVDPTNDDPETLTRYAEVYGVDTDRWWFLTGDEVEIYDLIRTSFKLPVGRDERARKDDPSTHWYTHDSRLVAVDRQGRVRGWYHHEEKREELIERMRHLASLAP